MDIFFDSEKAHAVMPAYSAGKGSVYGIPPLAGNPPWGLHRVKIEVP